MPKPGAEGSPTSNHPEIEGADRGSQERCLKCADSGNGEQQGEIDMLRRQATKGAFEAFGSQVSGEGKWVNPPLISAPHHPRRAWLQQPR